MNIYERILYIIAFILSVVVHEYAHGYVAYRLGDPTAKNAGRLSLNPLVHVDFLGLLSMIFFKIGWAKGVPINPMYFKNRKRDTIIVSAAGIITNFILAIIFSVFLRIVNIQNYYVLFFFYYFIIVNVMLGVFNLLPFPPLDGSKILASLLPNKFEYYFYKYEKYLYVILLVLVFSNSVGNIIYPIIDKILDIILY